MHIEFRSKPLKVGRNLPDKAVETKVILQEIEINK